MDHTFVKMASGRYLIFGFLFTLGFSLSAQPPTVHSSNIVISNVYCHYFNVSWTSGNGQKRVVFAREGSAVNVTPSYNQSYNANDSFGKGTIVGSDVYTVFNGTGNSFKIQNLKKNTTYYLAIFEFNANSGVYEYYTASGYATASQLTENITPNFTIDDTYQCLADNSFSFTNSSSNSRGESMTYSWDFGDKKSSTATDPVHVYTEGAIFKVVLTASSPGCKAPVTIQDTVGVPFITYFELDQSISGNDSQQCFTNNRFNLVNKFKVPPPIYGTWDRTKNKWSTTQGHSGTAADFDFIANNYGKITVKLIQSRQVSKGGEYCVDSFQRDFYVLPPPLKNVDVDFSDTLLCLNAGGFTFSHNGTDIAKTTWYFGDGSSSNQNPVTHDYASVGKYNVQLKVVDNYGCRDSMSDSVALVTTPNNFFTGLNGIYCINDPIVQLKPNLHGGTFKGGSVNATDSTFNPNAVGSYTVQYIYTLGNCIDTFTATTEVKDRPKVYLGKDTVICSGTTIPLDANTGAGGFTYLWNNGSTDSTLDANSGGIYWVKISNGFCTGGDTISIRNVVLPSVDLGNDTTICGGQKIHVKLKADAGTISWNDGSTEFERDLTESGFYQVTFNHPCGIVTDSVTIDILPYACEMFVPNIFSPNGDILNEFFRPLGFFKFTDMLIFDEYGMQLFYTDDLQKGWDGTYQDKKCQQGMYYYMIRYELPEGGSYVKKVAKGSVYLIQ